MLLIIFKENYPDKTGRKLKNEKSEIIVDLFIADNWLDG